MFAATGVLQATVIVTGPPPAYPGSYNPQVDGGAPVADEKNSATQTGNGFNIGGTYDITAGSGGTVTLTVNTSLFFANVPAGQGIVTTFI